MTDGEVPARRSSPWPPKSCLEWLLLLAIVAIFSVRVLPAGDTDTSLGSPGNAAFKHNAEPRAVTVGAFDPKQLTGITERN